MHPVGLYLVHPRYLVHPGHLPDPGDLMRTGEHGHRVLTTGDDVSDTCNNTSDCSRRFGTRATCWCCFEVDTSSFAECDASATPVDLTIAYDPCPHTCRPTEKICNFY